MARVKIIKEPFTVVQQKEIEKIVHNYLVDNPEVLIEASKTLQKKMVIKLKEQTLKAARENVSDLFRSADSPVIGNKNGKITLVEFFDYNCIHCRKMTEIIKALVKKNPDLRVVFKDFTIFGPNSVLAAKAGLAAREQGKYELLHEEMMNPSKILDKKAIERAVEEAKLNEDKFEKDLTNKKYDAVIEESTELAASKLKLRGTPAFFIAKTDIQTGGNAPIMFVPGQTTEKDLQEMINKVKK